MARGKRKLGKVIAIIPGGTHEVPLANPDAVNPIMLSFLKQER
jgi:pimeloyl-ACP methyl ester carboxylesterase